MKKTRPYLERIVRIMMPEAEAKIAARTSVPQVAKELSISGATFHRLRNHYGGMRTDAKKRLQEMKKVNLVPQEDRCRTSCGPKDAPASEPAAVAGA